MVSVKLTNRGLLRAVLLAFALFLVYRFVAMVAAIVLLLAAALLLAVILSAPVEALHWRKLSRPVATGLIILGALVVLALGGFLLFPVLADQASQVISQLPGAFSRLLEEARSLAQSYGFQMSSGSSSLSSVASSILGGVFGLFSGLASFVTGLLIVLLAPVYLVAQPEPAVRFFARLFPPERRGRVRGVLSEVRSGLLSWLKDRLVSMAVVGALSTVALYLRRPRGALPRHPHRAPGIRAARGADHSRRPATAPGLRLGGHSRPCGSSFLAYLVLQQVESNILKPLPGHAGGRLAAPGGP